MAISVIRIKTIVLVNHYLAMQKSVSFLFENGGERKERRVQWFKLLGCSQSDQASQSKATRVAMGTSSQFWLPWMTQE